LEIVQQGGTVMTLSKRIAVLSLGLAFSAAAALAQQPLPARIKIGVLDSLTGGAATAAAAASQPGIKLAIKELKDSGGTLAGRPVDFVFGDTASDPTQAVNEARRLINREGVNAMIGPFLSSFTLPTAPIYTEAKIPSAVVATSSAFNPGIHPYGFVAYYDSSLYAKFMVDFVVDQLKAKSVGIIASSGALDRQAVEDFKKSAAARNLPVTDAEQHEFRAPDITPNILNLRRSNPDVLIQNASTAEEGALVIKTMADLGWKVPVVSHTAVLFAPNWMKLAGPDIFKGENIYGLTFTNFLACKNEPLGQPMFAKFLARMKDFDPQNFDKMFQLSLSTTYDAAKLLFASIDATKSVDGPTVAAWTEANAKNFPAISGKMNASKTNHFLLGSDAMWMVTRPDLKRADGMLPKPGC
jgi:branched-chain amino acid transport system substrate-binding protein